jgi:hypothetical protein
MGMVRRLALSSGKLSIGETCGVVEQQLPIYLYQLMVWYWQLDVRM